MKFKKEIFLLLIFAAIISALFLYFFVGTGMSRVSKSCSNLSYYYPSSVTRVYSNEEEKEKILTAEKINFSNFDKNWPADIDLSNIEKIVMNEKNTKDIKKTTRYEARISKNSPILVEAINDLSSNGINYPIEFRDKNNKIISRNDCQKLLGNDYYQVNQSIFVTTCNKEVNYIKTLYFLSNGTFMCGIETIWDPRLI
jgi:hypothetical protein